MYIIVQERLIRIKIISERKGEIDVNTYGRRRLEVEKTKLADDREQKGRKDCTRRGWVTLLDSDEILCGVDCFSPLESSRRRPDWRSWRFTGGISQREGETMEKKVKSGRIFVGGRVYARYTVRPSEMKGYRSNRTRDTLGRKLD